MAFPTDSYTAADLAVYIPSVWGQKINDFFKEELIMARFFTDRSSELSGGGNTLITPGLTAMTANAKANGTAVILNSPTESSINLVVNNWFETSFAIEDLQAAQIMKSYSLQENLAKNAAYVTAKKLEVAIAALFSGFSTSVGASTTNLADSEIRQAIATLESTAVSGLYKGDVAFFLHPNTFWKQLQNVDKFSLAINSPVNDPTAKVPDAHLYGIPVFRSPNIPTVSGVSGRYNVLAHKDAIHFATASLPNTKSSMVGTAGVRVQSNYIPDYLSTITTADIAYGVIENRDNAGIILYSAQ